MEILSRLGIDPRLLLAQIINFIILLLVLYRFAYRPVLKMLNERTHKIEKGIKDAEAAKKKLMEMEEKEKQVLVEARKEAQKIITKAEEVAKKNAEEIVTSAKAQAEIMKSSTEKQLELEKNKIMSEVKTEIASLVVTATEKILGEKMDKENDQQLIEKYIK